ncbi:MAG: GIY-YIG nuclease family protein [Desulfobacteraceae bacterium]|nr:GIY-YIG nuclease family protein [Desulfobacteraceae bacterium]
MKTWWVYMVRCRDGSLYTGIAVDVAKRFREHQEQGKRGSKYLRGRGPLILVFKKKLGEKSLALKVEMQIKRLKKEKKESLLIQGAMIQDMIHGIEKDIR